MSCISQSAQQDRSIQRCSNAIIRSPDGNIVVFTCMSAYLSHWREVRLTLFQGFNVSITYTPISDSYQVNFFRSTATTPATPAIIQDGEPSPHHLIAPLLSNRLNDLTSDIRAARTGITGKTFIRLLKSTLPLLLEFENIKANSTDEFPALIVNSVEAYRLVWDIESTRRSVSTRR